MESGIIYSGYKSVRRNKNADSTVSEKYQHSKKGRRTDCLDRLLLVTRSIAAQVFCLLYGFKKDFFFFFASGLNKKEYFTFPNSPFPSICGVLC